MATAPDETQITVSAASATAASQALYYRIMWLQAQEARAADAGAGNDVALHRAAWEGADTAMTELRAALDGLGPVTRPSVPPPA